MNYIDEREIERGWDNHETEQSGKHYHYIIHSKKDYQDERPEEYYEVD